jgi:hypothetical protein
MQSVTHSLVKALSWATRGRTVRHLAVVLVTASTLSTTMIVVGTPRIALADYSGLCLTGSQGFYQYYWGWAYTGSTSGAIYGAYSDIYFGQHLQTCSFPTLLSTGGTFVEGADMTSKTYGTSALVQLALGQAARQSTTFFWTPSDTDNGFAGPATWYPWAPVIGHIYRQFIWQSLDVYGAHT